MLSVIDCNKPKECTEEKSMCMYRLVGCDVYLCDLSVFELGRQSAARSGQAKLKAAKPSYRWEAAK